MKRIVTFPDFFSHQATASYAPLFTDVPLASTQCSSALDLPRPASRPLPLADRATPECLRFRHLYVARSQFSVFSPPRLLACGAPLHKARLLVFGVSHCRLVTDLVFLACLVSLALPLTLATALFLFMTLYSVMFSCTGLAVSLIST